MRVAQIGNIVNVAYNVTKFLRKKNYLTDLFIVIKNNRLEPNANPKNEDNLKVLPKWIRLLDTAKPFFLFSLGSIMKKYDLIHAYTLAPIYMQFLKKPLISHATGTDLREYCFGKGIMPFLLRRAYHRSKIVFFTNPDLVLAAKKLKLAKYAYIPLLIDVSKYKKASKSKNKKFTFFCPTRWDWKIKGTDSLLSAFAEFSKRKFDVKLVLVDLKNKDEDYKKTKELIHKLKLDDKVEFVNHLNKNELIAWYTSADVVMDQFKIGSLGLVSLEGMACARPVISYYDRRVFDILKEEVPPILNAGSKLDVLKQMNFCYKNKSKLTKMGETSRKWIIKTHGPEAVVKKIEKYYKEIGFPLNK